MVERPSHEITPGVIVSRDVTCGETHVTLRLADEMINHLTSAEFHELIRERLNAVDGYLMGTWEKSHREAEPQEKVRAVRGR
jgi:hypothetical protein